MKRLCFTKKFFLFFMFFSICTLMLACDILNEEKDDKKVISSRSYSGHESDADANNFVNVYPAKAATRLDDCQTCHGGGTLTKVSGGTTKVDNACTWCHYIEFPDTATYTAASHPQSYYDTLNSYGKAYKDNGQTVDALIAIASLDSDGDGYTNDAEINDNRFPGNPASKPGQPLAVCKEFSWTQINTMTKHNQFMMMNTTKQQYDDYVNYTGVTIAKLLESAGVDMTNVTGITVFAPDGFKTQFDLADINDTFPEATFYSESGLNYENTNAIYDCTTYPSNIHSLIHGQVIGSAVNPDGLRMILAYQREGVDLSMSYYDGTTGRLEGEGPYRLVIPQNGTNPGKPDRGSKSSQKTPDDGYNFVSSYDHNAGSCNRGACVIRIDPMPAGYEEFDTTNGWALIQDKKVVIYGQGVK